MDIDVDCAEFFSILFFFFASKIRTQSEMVDVCVWDERSVSVMHVFNTHTHTHTRARAGTLACTHIYTHTHARTRRRPTHTRTCVHVRPIVSVETSCACWAALQIELGQHLLFAMFYNDQQNHDSLHAYAQWPSLRWRRAIASLTLAVSPPEKLTNSSCVFVSPRSIC